MFHYGLKTAIPRSSPPPQCRSTHYIPQQATLHITPTIQSPPSIPLISSRHPNPSGDECSTTDSRGGRSSSPERVFASFNSRPSLGSNTSLGIRCSPFRSGFCSWSAKHTLCCRDIHPLKLLPHSLASTPRSSPPPHNAAALTPSPARNPMSCRIISLHSTSQSQVLCRELIPHIGLMDRSEALQSIHISTYASKSLALAPKSSQHKRFAPTRKHLTAHIPLERKTNFSNAHPRAVGGC